MGQTVTAEMAFSGALCKRFAAEQAVRFFNDADITLTCLAESDSLPPGQYSAAARADSREKELTEGQANFFYKKTGNFLSAVHRNTCCTFRTARCLHPVTCRHLRHTVAIQPSLPGVLQSRAVCAKSCCFSIFKMYSFYAAFHLKIPL